MAQLNSIKTLSGLVGYWPCDEATGSSAADVTANPVDASVSGSGAVLAGWNSPGGLGAVGLRPTTSFLASSAVCSVSGATSKTNVGDTFSVGMFFRRRAAVNGSLYARGALVGSLGSELLSNSGFDDASFGSWAASNATLDTSVTYAGSKSARVDVPSNNAYSRVGQIVSSVGAGKYTLSFWYKHDANTAGRMGVNVLYAPSGGGSSKYLTSAGTWQTSSVDAGYMPYSTEWRQATIEFTLPEAASSLAIDLKRSPTAGGGAAYTFWVDSATLKGAAYLSTSYALNLSDTGVVSLVSGGTTTVASSDPAYPIDDYLGWHFVALTKSGSTTKIYIDGVDRTVAGTNVTFSATGLGINWFSGGLGLQPVVGAHMFLANAAMSAADVAAVYKSANMLPDKASPLTRKRTKIGMGCSTWTVSRNVPKLDAQPELVAARLSELNTNLVREFISWWQVEGTQGSYDWTTMDRIVNTHVAAGIPVGLVFPRHSPGWAVGAGTLTLIDPLTGTIPGVVSRGITVADANNNATNGGAGANAYATWRSRFVAFIVAAVHRYKDCIQWWELGNEETNGSSVAPASVHIYADWYTTARDAILAELGADAPQHRIAIAGLARLYTDLGATDAYSYVADEFVRGLLDAGVDIDCVSAHPYITRNSHPGVHTVNAVNFDALHQIRDTCLEYGKSPSIEITEIGWYTEHTTIASGSNGASLPQSTISVADATRLYNPWTSLTLAETWPFSGGGGTIYIQTSDGMQAVRFTGISGNTLTGCTGGTGTMSTGGLVSGSPYPATQAQAAAYFTATVDAIRNYMSTFCDTLLYYTLYGLMRTGVWDSELALYADQGTLYAPTLTQPKTPLVEAFKAAATGYNPTSPKPVLTPLGAVALKTSGNPTVGVTNVYEAGSPLTVTLPPLLTLDPGSRLVVSTTAASATLTVATAGTDTYFDTTSSLTLVGGVHCEFQVVVVAGVKLWQTKLQFSSSPLSFVTAHALYSGGALGTPSSGTLTNCTGLPQSGVVSLTTDLAAKVTSGGALGTPSSGTLTNCSGLPQSGVTNLTTDLAAKVASGGALGTPSSGTLTNCSGLPQSGVVNLTTDLAGKVASGGALGTPSSGTLTNCSGLPQSGVDNLTTDLAAKANAANPSLTGAAKVASTGSIEVYNTADQTTNYERISVKYNSNVAEIGTLYGGTGTARAIRIGASATAGTGLARYIQISPVAPFWQFLSNTSANGALFQISSSSGLSYNASSGLQNLLVVDPTIAQSSTAGYTMLLINPTETSTGSGTKRLIDAQVGGSSKFTVDNTGTVSVSGTAATVRAGTGSPESAVTASVGSMYLRTDGGAGSTLYVKESGSGNTGWVAK